MALFQENKYTKWYYMIIASARNRQRHGYIEQHHVLPHCMGGTDDKENLVALTPREHFVCHNLLTRMTTGPDQRKMFHAFWLMSNMNSANPDRYVKHTSASYARVREAHAKSIGDRLRGRKRGPLKTPRRPTTDQARKNMSLGRQGIKFSPQHCENLRHARGKKWVTDGRTSKMVAEAQFIQLTQEGWKAGRLYPGR